MKKAKPGMNVVAFVKDGERYIFLWDDESKPEALRTLGKFAADKELNFSWYDAAVVAQKIRRMSP